MGAIERFRTLCWSNLNRRTVNGKKPAYSNESTRRFYLSKGIELRMSRAEFYSWIEEQREYLAGIYASGDYPSIDRVDSSGHYEISNIRIMPLKENLSRARALGNARKAQRADGLCIPKPCVMCGKIMSRRKGVRKAERVNEFQRRKTCSVACRMKWQNRFWKELKEES